MTLYIRFYKVSGLYTTQTISDVMQPAAARAVKEWISKADDRGISQICYSSFLAVKVIIITSFFFTSNAERDVAIRLFSSLGSRRGHRIRSSSEPNIRAPSHQQHFPHPPGQRLH